MRRELSRKCIARKTSRQTSNLKAFAYATDRLTASSVSFSNCAYARTIDAPLRRTSESVQLALYSRVHGLFLAFWNEIHRLVYVLSRLHLIRDVIYLLEFSHFGLHLDSECYFALDWQQMLLCICAQMSHGCDDNRRAGAKTPARVVSSFLSHWWHVQVRGTCIVVACRLVSPYRPYHVLSGRGSSFVRVRVKIPRCRCDHETWMIYRDLFRDFVLMNAWYWFSRENIDISALWS